VEFINKAGPISLRAHMLELLPGVGKRHTEELLKEREKALFTSFEDVKKRVSSVPEPKKLIVQRILDELEGKDRYRLFVRA
jgi:putative nucleotide binding protein